MIRKIVSCCSLAVIFQTFLSGNCYQIPGCHSSDYELCINIADPLIKEPQLIFPDNMQDIDYVCTRWNNLVDCVKKYTDRCFTEKERRLFNKAIENPIESVHQMCTQPDYQREYLHYAPCMKNTVKERSYCAPHYAKLVDLVSKGDDIDISKSDLCCSHYRFRDCILKETNILCDRGIQNGPAVRFSAHILDKSLSFIQEQCFNYIPNSGDCGLTPSSPSLDGSTSPSIESRWNTYDEQLSSSKSIFSSALTPPKSSATLPWMDSSEDDMNLASIPTLGSRSRPSSYGRAKSWSKNPTEINRNTSPTFDSTVQTYAESLPSVSSPEEPWHQVDDNPIKDNESNRKTFESTTEQTTTTTRQEEYESSSSIIIEESTEKLPSSEPVDDRSNDILYVSDEGSFSSTETWYPAAGHQIDNDVETPNQQGLIRPSKDEIATNSYDTMMNDRPIIATNDVGSKKPNYDSKGVNKEAYLGLTIMTTTAMTLC